MITNFTTNIEVAILSKMNELAERHGVKPFDFVAQFFSHPNMEKTWCLRIESGVLLDPKHKQLLDKIGINENSKTLSGTIEYIYKALESALDVAPRRR